MKHSGYILITLVNAYFRKKIIIVYPIQSAIRSGADPRPARNGLHSTQIGNFCLKSIRNPTKKKKNRQSKNRPRPDTFQAEPKIFKSEPQVNKN